MINFLSRSKLNKLFTNDLLYNISTKKEQIILKIKFIISLKPPHLRKHQLIEHIFFFGKGY